MLAQQQAESLTKLPDPASMAGQLPSTVTPAMLEGNIGLRWGTQEFLYRDYKPLLAKEFSKVKDRDVRQAAKKYLSESRCSVITLQPASHGTN